MDLASVLLIALPAVVAYIVFRVGLSSREAAPARGTAHRELRVDPDTGVSARSVRDPDSPGSCSSQAGQPTAGAQAARVPLSGDRAKVQSRTRMWGSPTV